MSELSDTELGQVTAGHPGAELFQVVFGVTVGAVVAGIIVAALL
jgi:hypothetical protein